MTITPMVKTLHHALCDVNDIIPNIVLREYQAARSWHVAFSGRIEHALSEIGPLYVMVYIPSHRALTNLILVRNMYTNIGQVIVMNIINMDVKSRIYARVCASNPRQVWTVLDFADFGPRDAVDKALQRLVVTGKLRRIDRGLYDRPSINQLTGKPMTADYRAIIDAIARRDQTRMLVDGMTAANDLGLSDAVPGRVIVHSDTRLKPLRLGNLTITFRPTSASKLYWAGRPAMRIVQALHWLKPKISNLEDGQRIRQRIASMLSDRKGGAILRKDLKKGIASLPSWMQDFLRDMVSGDRPSSAKSSGRKLDGKRRKAPVV